MYISCQLLLQIDKKDSYKNPATFIASTLKCVGMMVVKVLFLLAMLGLVSLPAASATVQQQQGE